MPRKGSTWTPLRLRRLAEKQAAWEEKAKIAIQNGKRPVGRPPKERAQRLSQHTQLLRVRKSVSKSQSDSDLSSSHGSRFESCGDVEDASLALSGGEKRRASAANATPAFHNSALSMSWSRGELAEEGAMDLPTFFSQSFEAADFANNPRDVSGLSAFRNDDGSVDDGRTHEMNSEYSREQRESEDAEVHDLFCMVEEPHPMDLAVE